MTRFPGFEKSLENCIKKRQWQTYDKAAEFAERQNYTATRWLKGWLNPYECPHCEMYHVTSQTKKPPPHHEGAVNLPHCEPGEWDALAYELFVEIYGV